MAGYPQGLAPAYIDKILKFTTQNPTTNGFPSYTSGGTTYYGLQNLYLAIHQGTYDGGAATAISEPTTGGYVRVAIATGSSNFGAITSSTATLTEPSGSVTANTNALRYVQLLTPQSFLANSAATLWTVNYIALMDQLTGGSIVWIGPNTQSANTVAQNAVFTVPAGQQFGLTL